MGSSISTIVSTTTDSCDTRREVEDLINRLVILSEVKATTHYQRVVKRPIDADLLPIDKIVRRLHVAHCGIQQNADAVRDAIEKYLGPYLKPDVRDGLTATICLTLSHLLTNLSPKNSSEVTSYAVTISPTGTIGRIDCYMFYYKFRSPDLNMILDNCLVTSLIVSRCDARRLRVRDMGLLADAAYSVPLPGEGREEAEERRSRIEAMLVAEVERAVEKAVVML